MRPSEERRLIEIGRERASGILARRLASALGTISALLLIVWLVRGLLSIRGYSESILLVSFALIFLGRLASTRTRSGVGRAVSSLLWNVAAACIIVLIAIWFLGWVASIQNDVFPAVLSNQVPALVIVALATGLAAYAVRQLSPISWRSVAGRPPIVVGGGSAVVLGRTKISPKTDAVGLPVKKAGRTVGCVLLGDLGTTVDTPMGSVSMTLQAPVTTFGIPFTGPKASDAQVTGMTGKNADQLIEEARVDLGLREFDSGADGIDLSFVHVRKDMLEESVDVGPISVRRGPDGERVSIGSFTIDPDDGDEHKAHSKTWFARAGRGPGYLAATEYGMSAKWNGSTLRVRGDTMRLSVGADGFSYSPSEVETYSPLHTLHVTGEKVTLTTKKFALNISGDKVVLRGNEGSKSTDSSGLAKDLKDLLADAAKKHVRSVMQGQPIDLEDMLARTDEALRKYD